MAFGMFSSNPLEAFERGYGYDSFNPWTNSYPSFYRQRSQSARRFVNPSFMWNFPTEIMMSDEEDYPQRKKQCAPHRKGKCRKCKPKTTKTKQEARHQPISDENLIENNDRRPSKNTDNGHNDSDNHESVSPEHQMSHLSVTESDEEEKDRQTQDEEEVSRNEEENSDNYETADESEINEPAQQPQESMYASQTEDTFKDSENQPEVEIPEVNHNNDELPVTENSCQSENAKDDVVTEECKQEETIQDEITKKLEQIEVQLKKARELVSNDTFSELSKTEKQRLYFTEMLLRCILDLDTIETQGNETVKLRRREAVREIQKYLDQVENS
ncbi:histone acetyltransferase KAT6B [Exaiptasia diaphana]|uniref:BAG domain-containing protein n=1 Tax=Exaiptasia diaphana TaxID=2652724 RepID=A0A913X4G1_EXADI|nr:histone acetyltransferase KAT6B [Exaiptasia diaphana]KXJ15322.1 hypothetical protein AC249_AIPGENE5592 [Exaiptasia diaphana]